MTKEQQERLKQLEQKVAENKAMSKQEKIELQHLQRVAKMVVVKK